MIEYVKKKMYMKNGTVRYYYLVCVNGKCKRISKNKYDVNKKYYIGGNIMGVSKKIEIYRVFDLGGSGLKTALVIPNIIYQKINPKLDIKNIDKNVDEENADFIIFDKKNLGNCQIGKNIRTWIREKLPSIDKEINSDFLYFGFSMAGFDKLWENNDNHNKYKLNDIPEIFGFPNYKCFYAKDATSHRLAAELTGVNYPHVNFAIGTGVGISTSDSNGEEIELSKLRNSNGKYPWEWEVFNSVVWEILSTNGLDNLISNKIHQPEKTFVKLWNNFILDKWIPFCDKKGWPRPKSMSFTGGVFDKYKGLTNKFYENIGGISSDYVTNHNYFISPLKGNAGYIGAAICAQNKKSYD